MAGLKYLAYRSAFEFLWISQIPRIVRATSRCRGAIYTLHRVLPERPADFSPNAILQVTPEYLEYFIVRMGEIGVEMVSLEEGLRRTALPDATTPFAVLTFDDAYRDNLIHALPVLRRRKCPFTLYVPTALVDGVGEVWWQALEDMIADVDVLAVPDTSGEMEYLECTSTAQKYEVYDQLYWRLRDLPEMERVNFFKELARRYGLDLNAHCRELIMDWSELATFVNEPLCTIGAHTVHHYELAKLSDAEARQEIVGSVDVLDAQFGLRPKHLSYPIGRKRSAGPREFELATELGFTSAVTTRPGGLYYADRKAPTSLPRISLNGNFQDRRFVDIMAAGAVFSGAATLLGDG